MVDFAELKKFFLFNLIGSLIICALVAVITVLVGVFNEITSRVLFTLAMVVLHSLVSLAFIWDDERQKTFERLSFFINVIFVLIVLSFLTSIFGIWKIIPGDIVGHMYMTYALLAFASLHGDILSKALSKENYLDLIIYLNYVFMAIVVLMFLPIIYLTNPSFVLGEAYFRVLGAAGIIDGTLSVLTIIFYKLYINSHPHVENDMASVPVDASKQVVAEKRKGLSVWVWILIIYLAIQIFSTFVFRLLF